MKRQTWSITQSSGIKNTSTKSHDNQIHTAPSSISNMKIINISDLVNPDTGKSYRQENNERIHNIPVGTLVEVDFDDECLESPKKGLRLFVVGHDRDCDGTPLYSLSFNKDWKEEPSQHIPRIAFRMQIDSGYSEECLKVIEK